MTARVANPESAGRKQALIYRHCERTGNKRLKGQRSVGLVCLYDCMILSKGVHLIVYQALNTQDNKFTPCIIPRIQYTHRQRYENRNMRTYINIYSHTLRVQPIHQPPTEAEFVPPLSIFPVQAPQLSGVMETVLVLLQYKHAQKSKNKPKRPDDSNSTKQKHTRDTAMRTCIHS